MAKAEKVRLLVGTRKGGYIAESDVKRKRWTVHGPFHAGRDLYHVAADPRHPGDLYAAVNSPFFGPILVRSANWGKTWKEIAPPMMPVSSERPPPDPSATQPARPIVNLWHIEPGHASEPDTIFLGIDPASLFRSDDRGASWAPVPGLNEHPTRDKWNPGAGGMCLHTILIDPSRPKRMYVGISAAGTFRSDDAGEHWRPVNKGVLVSFLPTKKIEVGQCVHHVVADPVDHDTFYRQDHDGIHVSHDAMDSWKRVGKSLKSDFGFVVGAAPALPGQAFFVPLFGESRTTFDGGMQVYRWNDRAKTWKTTMPMGRWPGEFGTHREGLATDSLDPAGVYVGTTNGQLFYSRDGGRGWDVLPHSFPAIHSVAVSSPGPDR